MRSTRALRVTLALLAPTLGLAAAAQGYRTNSALLFHGGLLLLACGFGLGAVAAARRQRGALVIAANTGLMLCLALVFLQLLAPSEPQDEPGSELAPAYSYRAASGDSARFRRWWKRYFAEWERTRPLYTRPDPTGVNPYATIPGATANFFDSEIHINALGFRGPEIARDKDGAYRIVVLGESTTFGATLRREDRPWPELLQERIARELECDAPVQVVNAGLPGFTLANNLARWRSDILPLDPDLVISYHGYNGFPYLMGALPPALAQQAPSVPERPSWLLERVESALRIAWFRRRYDAARQVSDEASDADLERTRYARLYRELATLARARKLPLVLCTFPLAVTEQSPEPVIRFYELAFPDVRPRLIANRWHTRVVREVARRFALPVIDTTPGLEGEYDEDFIDLIHLTQAGRERLSANVFEGLREILRNDPKLNCKPSAGS